MSLNKVMLIGFLGQDPVSRQFDSGSVCNFSLATSYKKKDGSDETTWHRCQAWGKTGEICQQYLVKGSQVYVEGRLNTRKYTKDGVEREATEIVVENVQFLSKTGNQQSGGVGQSTTPPSLKTASPNSSLNQAYGNPLDADIPF